MNNHKLGAESPLIDKGQTNRARNETKRKFYKLNALWFFGDVDMGYDRQEISI